MTGIKAFLKSHSLSAYFVLTFLISWGGVFMVVARAGFPGSTEHKLFPIALVANQSGPILAGILLTALVYGRVGLREFLARLLRLLS